RDELIDRTYAAVDRAGFAAGAASAGPSERLRQFLDEQLLPALAHLGEKFTELCAAVQARITAAGDAMREFEQVLRGERFSGYNTQMMIVVAATADCLAKLLPGFFQGQLDFSHFANVDWAMLALAYLMYRDSREATQE